MDQIIVKKLKPARRPPWVQLLRWVFLGGLVGGMLVVGLLAPIWRQTPRGTSPVVRVRTLDLIQAASLRRTALAEASAGRSKESIHAWRMAIANRPGYRPLMRQALESMAGQSDLAVETRPMVLGIVGSLFLGSALDPDEVDVVVRLLGRYGRHDDIVRIGLPEMERLRPGSAQVLAEACLRLGRFRDFEALWSRHGGESGGLPVMELCRTAWLASAGPKEGRASALQALLASSERPGSMRALARSLVLVVAASIGDYRLHEKVFTELGDGFELSPLDHVRRWRLLHRSGYTREACRMVQAYAEDPDLAVDAVRMAEAMLDFGMKQEGITVLRRQTQRFPSDLPLWALCADQLLEGADADDLRWMVAGIRTQPVLARSLAPHAQLLETAWYHRTGRGDAAREAAGTLVRMEDLAPELARRAAQELARCGFHDGALSLFIQAEERFASDAHYWLERLESARRTLDGSQLLATAEAAYRREPSNLVFANNLAAALLFLRQRPEQAVGLTFDVLVQAPQMRNAALNHAMALLQAGRLEEGRGHLVRLTRSPRDADAEAWYQMAWFEYHAARGDCEALKALARSLPTDGFLPSQVDWIQKTLGRCAGR